MPNIKSAKKRVKVTATKNLNNRIFKSAYRTTIKKFYQAIEDGNKSQAEALYKAVIKKTDHAVVRHIIHKNAAAHKM